MLEGYDLTLNYVREPEENSAETMIPVSQRIGISAKGDLGPFGIYGALGYYFVIGKFFQKIYNRYYRIITVPRLNLGFLNSWRPYLGQFRK